MYLRKSDADASSPPTRQPTEPGRSGYRELVHHRLIRRAALGAFIGRLPTGVAVLGILLLIERRTGTFGQAGIIVAAYSLASAVGMPLATRLIDQFGPRVLVACSLVNLGGLAAVAASSSHENVWLTSVAAIVAGAAQPSLTSAFRAFCAIRLTDSRTRTAAYSVDAVVIEITFIIGPPIAAAGAAAGRPELTLYGAGVATVLGSLLFVSAVGARPFTGGPGDRSARALHERGLWLLMGISALTMAAIAFAEISILARAAAVGAAGDSGLILALWAMGSVVGGIGFGARTWPGTRRQQLAVAMTVAALLFLPLAAPGPLPTMLPTAFIAGLALAPAATITTAILSELLSSKVKTEAFGWLTAATVLGGSLGYALAGTVVDLSGERVTVVCGAVLAALVVPLAFAIPLRDGAGSAASGEAPGPK